MPSYLVERYLPSMAAMDIEAAVVRLRSAEARRPATAPRHLWTALIATEETCLSLFEAASASAVASANVEAGFPFDRVIEALLFPAPDGNS